MKYILLFLLLMGLNAAAQTVKPLSKIIIEYNNGVYGKLGSYSFDERFEIARFNNAAFKINHYFQTKDIGTGNKSTKEIVLVNYPLISKRTIDSLFVQLNTTKNNFNVSFIKTLLTKPTKKQILKISRQFDGHYKFEKKYSDSANENIEKIENFDKLDSFINLNKPSKIYGGAADVADEVSVSYIYPNDTINYRGQLLLGQSFVRTTEDINEKGIVNLEINTIIMSFLPQTSFLRRHLDINSLTYRYIRWYIDSVTK